MVAENVIAASPDVLNELVLDLGRWGRWLQAIGLIVIIWIIVQVVNWVISRKRMKEITLIRKDLERLEKKVDKLGRK